MVSKKKNIEQSETVKLVSGQVQAGFATWAEEDEGMATDLNIDNYLIEHREATFLVRASGDSMIEAGIHNGDLLVVDRSRYPASGKVVVVVVDGEATIKRLVKRQGRLFLCPANPTYPDIDITGHEETVIWGVATYVVHQL